MRIVRLLGVVAAVAAVAGVGYVALQSAGSGGAQAAVEPLVATPTRVDNFRLTDQNLQSHELYRLADAKAVVIVTQDDGCPVIRNTATALRALRQDYAGKGVEFMMLNPSTTDTRAEVQAEAKDYGYDMPILRDTNQLVGEQLGVTRTAEVFVIDPKTWKIVYRGPLDDRVTYERQKAEATQTWARTALDSLVGGQPVTVASQPAVGCLIDFPGRNRAALQNISYAHTIAPIIQDKCVSCHQPGGIGPMPLTSYDKIKAFSPMIREVIRTERMPPWRADPEVGKFHDDKSLTPAQIASLVHWVEAGSPRGTGADPLAAKTFQAAEWPLGKPDLVLDIPAYTVPANGIVDYQRPFVLNPLAEGKWLRASTIKVGERQAVHHVLTGYMAVPPAPGTSANESRWQGSVGGYAVGAESTIEPTDIGVYMPAGGAIGFQMHYTPFGKQVVDHSQIALYFYDKQPKLMMRNAVIADPNIMIPPNTESYKVVSYVTFPKDAILYSAFPHAHYRGSSSQLTIRYPDGTERLLLALPRYDFNWQRDYNFAQPIKVPAGSKLIATYTYDNSKRNPANPDPNRTVPWGDQSFDEMLYTALRYRWLDETSAKQTTYDQLMAQGRLMGILDSNVDGKLEMSELTGPIGSRLKASFKLLDTDGDGTIDEKELAAAQSVFGSRRASR
jgi:peroxiredoxin